MARKVKFHDVKSGEYVNLIEYAQAPKSICLSTELYSQKELGWLPRLILIDMIDLWRLSHKHGYKNMKGAFIRYPRTRAMEQFQIPKTTAEKAFKQLIDLELIEEVEVKKVGAMSMRQIYIDPAKFFPPDVKHAGVQEVF